VNFLILSKAIQMVKHRLKQGLLRDKRRKKVLTTQHGEQLDMTLNSGLAARKNYRALKETDIADYVAADASLSQSLGGAKSAWRVREVGDGNLNLVFIIEGPSGGLVVKQALPYVRLVGEGWPLPLDRAYFEAEALAVQGRVAAHLIPKVHRYDHDLALIIMEYLSPHIILRKGLIAGIVYPKLADDMAHFMASTLFSTSDLALPAAAKKAEIAKFAANTALCKITEDLVFTDPYWLAPMNSWLPALDDVAASIRADGALKVGAMELKQKFLSEAQTLVHGDLHSGSIMATSEDTRVIDPEFAFFGPMGFDIGAYLANLLLAYFSQKGHEKASNDRAVYRRWILETFINGWKLFDMKFRALWHEQRGGDGYSRLLFEDQKDDGALRLAQDRFMTRLFEDTLGFAGVKMIRRTLGLAKVADMESIADTAIRAQAQTKALRFARDLVVRRDWFKSIDTVAALAEDMNNGTAQ
jgi:5-methylthioribose kinase